jgi:predicted transcriptional regulator
MKDKILQSIIETPRTVKDLAELLGVSKNKIVDNLMLLPVKKEKIISYNGKSSPVVLIKYTLK